MSALSQTSGVMLCAALALSTLFPTGSSIPALWDWDAAAAAHPKPSWHPWLLLTTLGLGSGAGAVLYPLPFDIAFG